MADVILAVDRLMKSFGGLRATNDLSLEVLRGECHAIIGPNGAGKTTFISQLQGMLAPDAGTITLNGRDITGEPAHRRARLGIARSFQITSLVPDFSVLDHAALAVQARLGHSFRFWKNARRDPALVAPAREAVETVGLASRENTLARDLSHGEARQLELAIAIAQQPKLLLLDEPMAGMGRKDGVAMTELLARLKRDYSIILIEHDMQAVFSLADRISVLVAGHIIKTGAPEVIRTDPDVRAAYLGH
ncbi:MAG TPA: ABC transporter ATP-binding protein [Beijerinckiaceae bacterium]|nr:ABC transporter ATP-binding protein [Rhodoblastus sp.]MCB9998236.1 ABC transporter ATP-binding protein [Methylobacteriaceae bacterium]MCC2100870.1 ABC transporter ATP-binding protein [Hyphomicrobiales bacterium]HRY03162.1 ABC transporter ATP-binding protein [Beijerinckiaceae bacterium]MCB1523904.1 ABC transporter ATP-binding protein [Rhodoblastus sp.]